ncbi:MAG: TIR domain-containing protein [Rubrivivax sp.]|nr:TIR domain-containing protein [Rubrivivax sp.]
MKSNLGLPREEKNVFCFEKLAVSGGSASPTMTTVFLCYAHVDNISDNPKERWVDRLNEMLAPIVRQDSIRVWSDLDIDIGQDWHSRIQAQLLEARAVVLFVSPAFLASDYIANSELPVLLHRAKTTGAEICPILLSPCLWDEAVYHFPDPVLGPNTLNLSSLQAVNTPTRTMIEATEAQQNRALMGVAKHVRAALTRPQR